MDLRRHHKEKSALVERTQCPLRPAMTFGKQRQHQESGSGGSGDPDADPRVAAGAEGPIESRANIVESSEMGHPFAAAWHDAPPGAAPGADASSRAPLNTWPVVRIQPA